MSYTRLSRADGFFYLIVDCHAKPRTFYWLRCASFFLFLRQFEVMCIRERAEGSRLRLRIRVYTPEQEGSKRQNGIGSRSVQLKLGTNCGTRTNGNTMSMLLAFAFPTFDTICFAPLSLLFRYPQHFFIYHFVVYLYAMCIFIFIKNLPRFCISDL